MPRSPIKATNSGDDRYRDRHLAVLRHVGLYRLTLKAAAASALADLGTEQVAGTTLNRLVLDGYLSSNSKEQGFSGKVPYYTLTAKGAAEAEVSPERATLDPSALRTHLAALWFCCLNKPRRHRLEPGDWEGILAEENRPPNNVAHCVAEEDGIFRIYRLYATDAHPQETLRKVRSDIEKSWNNTGLRDWIETHEYGFAVLTATPEAADHLSKALTMSLKDEPPVNELARVVVEHAPSPETLRAALTERSRDQ